MLSLIEELNDNEEVEHINTQRGGKINRKLKQGGIDRNLVLNTKRKR